MKSVYLSEHKGSLMYQYTFDEIETAIDNELAKQFNADNWMRPGMDENEILRQIREKGGAVWLNHKGEICFRPKLHVPFVTLEPTKAKIVIASYLEIPSVKILGNRKSDVTPDELLMVNEKFTPFENKEFYLQEEVYYRTAWKPTPYMQASATTEIPRNIKLLLMRLCNFNESYLKWVINWLAGFFQTRQRSGVALVFKGDQGSGKGIFFNQIITPLFGEAFCVTIDDDRLNTTFKDWISAKLFYNLNEISHDKRTRTQVKSFIKQLVTDSKVHVEAKYSGAKNEELFGMVLITSNELAPLEIEPCDRRFTVIQTAGSLKNDDIDTYQLVKSIKEELMSFAGYLNGFKLDWKHFNQALDTEEKRAIVHNTTDKVILLARALLDKDEAFFDLLRELDNALHLQVTIAFENGTIKKTTIPKLYDAIFEDNIKKKYIYERLSAYDVKAFGNTKKRDGYEHYIFSF